MAEPCEDADATSAALAQAALGPKRVEADGLNVEQHSLKDLIEADRYQRGKCAGSSARRGLRITKLLPGGTA